MGEPAAAEEEAPATNNVAEVPAPDHGNHAAVLFEMADTDRDEVRASCVLCRNRKRKRI